MENKQSAICSRKEHSRTIRSDEVVWVKQSLPVATGGFMKQQLALLNRVEVWCRLLVLLKIPIALSTELEI
jgi:hypothetical protein